MRIVVKTEDKNSLKTAVQASESSEILGESDFEGISIYRIKENVTFDSAISSNFAMSLSENIDVVGSKVISIEIENMEDMNMAFWQQFKLYRNDTVSIFGVLLKFKFTESEKSSTL